MTRARNDEWELAQDRNLGDGPEPGDQFGSAPVPLDEPIRAIRPSQSEADRAKARGTVQLKVRISAREREMLQWIQDQDGHDLSTIIGTYIRTEYDERAGERR